VESPLDHHSSPQQSRRGRYSTLYIDTHPPKPRPAAAASAAITLPLPPAAVASLHPSAAARCAPMGEAATPGCDCE
jgi:hypothetical protein